MYCPEKLDAHFSVGTSLAILRTKKNAPTSEQRKGDDNAYASTQPDRPDRERWRSFSIHLGSVAPGPHRRVFLVLSYLCALSPHGAVLGCGRPYRPRLSGQRREQGQNDGTDTVINISKHLFHFNT